MKKQLILFSILFIAVAALSFSPGCGSGKTETTGTVNTDLPSGTNSVGSFSGTVKAESLSVGDGLTKPGEDGGSARMAAFSAASNYIVAAVNSSTNQVYKATTGADGSFTISGLPSSSADYTLQILDNSGKYLGPLTTSSASGGKISTGLTSAGQGLGTISIPADMTAGAIVTDATDVVVDATEYARANTSGAPVGQLAGGKGADAILSGSKDTGSLDIDHDGVPNIFDADNNGSGTPDDLDSTEKDRGSEGVPSSSGVQGIGTIVNLKIGNTQDVVKMYNGTVAEKSATIGSALVIGLTMMPVSGKTISSAVCSAGASWRTTAKVTKPQENYANADLWSSTAGGSYGLNCSGTGCSLNLWPGEPISTGDTLFFDITYSDGTTETVVWSVSFGFKDIPKLVAFKDGTPTSKTDYTLVDIVSGTENGTIDKPIIHATGNDLWLKYSPPADENGDFLWEDAINHFKFEVFPHDASTFQQVHQADASSWNISGTVTIAQGPDPIDATTVPGKNFQQNIFLKHDGSPVTDGNWKNGAFAWEVQNSDFSILLDHVSTSTKSTTSKAIVDNYYTIVIPGDVLDESLTSGGTPVTVGCWDFDIAAQKEQSNAAIKLYVATTSGGCQFNSPPPQ
ncbi:MAG: carboxypeptidase-like regulatory domain-containing protein [Nitrospinota bacterium]|nr:carboxypeptidase-like regulatory domain-containing protein [Nitrospinota bacterium]